MVVSRIKRFFIGQPLSSQFKEHQRIPIWKALATLSSDALSSVAYATDAILMVLVASAVTAAAVWSIPIALGIIGLLIILTLSYRQTITAYPGGGGAYTVSRENLGEKAALVAGAALLLDYILTVSVSVASGVENLGAAFPWINSHREILGCFVIFWIMVLNLRGMRESATIFAIPTYFFIFSVFIMLFAGAIKILRGEVPEVAPVIHNFYPQVSLILVLRAFGSGCAALTGVEAISNGVPVFEEPAQQNAKTTLTWMSLILGAMFLGITALAHAFKIVPVEDQTVISLLGRGVFGNSAMYYIVQGSTAAILFLAANTAYADFPRLASILAQDRFLPRQLASRGDRLVFSNGIVGLSIVSGILIVVFKGSTLHLLPLYAIGVFISFTLSQAGMVVHHLKSKAAGRIKGLILNALGALTTTVVLVDIASTKFIHGAWVVMLLIPINIFLFLKIHRHYLAVGRELNLSDEIPPLKLNPVKHSVVIPVSGIHRGVVEAIRYAKSISHDVRACYVELDSAATDRITAEWKKWAPDVAFVVLKSPYRSVIDPLIKYLDDVEQIGHEDMVTVVVPEFVTTRWWHRVLHNQTALFIRTALLFKRRRVVTSVRYHLKKS